MTRDDRDRRSTEGTDGRPLGHTPGPLEEKEDAVAYANRTGQHDVTSLTPEGTRLRNAGGEGGVAAEDDGQPHPRATDAAGSQPGLDSSADPLR